MYLLAPSGYDNLIKTAQWFKNPLARKLHQEKGVEFGFELKGEPESIKSAPDLYWGYHLPHRLAAEYHYHPENRAKLLEGLKPVAQLKPAYANLHGVKLWWKPEAKQYIGRYQNRAEPEEYLAIFKSTISLIKELKQFFPKVTLENVTLCDYYRYDQIIQPLTSYQPMAGALNDLFYIKEKTGIEILLDIEHLILSTNFINRKKNYSDLKKVEFELNYEEQKVSDLYGFKIKKGYIPYAEPEIDYEKIAKEVKARHFHVTGSTQDVMMGKRDLTHGPIKVNDKTFRHNLKLILIQKPESILIETAKKSDNKCFAHLRENETELSFYTLCEILLEEL